MKSIKLIIIALLFAPLLTNCSVNSEQKATTPTGPTVTVTPFCAANPTDPSCDQVITVGNGQRRSMIGYFNVSNSDAYEDMLKFVFGFCDQTFITFTGEIFSTILASAIPTATNRCSKWNDRGALRMQFTGDGRVDLQAFAFSDFIQTQGQQLFYIPFTEFTAANNNQELFINLDRYAQGHRTGMILHIEGDVNSDHFNVVFNYFGEEIANIRMESENNLF